MCSWGIPGGMMMNGYPVPNVPMQSSMQGGMMMNSYPVPNVPMQSSMQGGMMMNGYPVPNVPMQSSMQGETIIKSDCDEDSDSDNGLSLVSYSPRRPVTAVARKQSDLNILRISGEGNEVEVRRDFDALLIEGENNVVTVKRNEKDANNACECLFPIVTVSGHCGICGKKRGQFGSNARRGHQGRKEMKFGVKGNNNKIIFD